MDSMIHTGLEICEKFGLWVTDLGEYKQANGNFIKYYLVNTS